MYKAQDWITVRETYRECKSIRETAKKLKISRNTVKKLLAPEKEPVYRRTVYKSCLDPYKESVIEWRAEPYAYSGARIFRELKIKGYSGSIGPVYRFLHKIGQDMEKSRLKEADRTRISCEKPGQARSSTKIRTAKEDKRKAMKKILVVVDMQKDFVDGALGTGEAVSIVPSVTEKIRSFDGEIFVTFDTHFENYMDTAEGKHLPVPHCIRGSEGWALNKEVEKALSVKSFHTVEKRTFGSSKLPALIGDLVGDEDFTIEIIGLCTDICVVSNALILKAFFPEVPISVDASCCAGVTPQRHEAALETMRSCQIDVR